MIGTAELILILCVVLVLFGGKKLPELARNLGRGMWEFKKACQGIEDEIVVEAPVEKIDANATTKPDSNDSSCHS